MQDESSITCVAFQEVTKSKIPLRIPPKQSLPLLGLILLR